MMLNVIMSLRNKTWGICDIETKEPKQMFQTILLSPDFHM